MGFGVLLTVYRTYNAFSNSLTAGETCVALNPYESPPNQNQRSKPEPKPEVPTRLVFRYLAAATGLLLAYASVQDGISTWNTPYFRRTGVLSGLMSSAWMFWLAMTGRLPFTGKASSTDEESRFEKENGLQSESTDDFDPPLTTHKTSESSAQERGSQQQASGKR